MPESGGRYQSRILSFLSQQSMQLRDRLLQNVRQVGFDMSWGVQAILYPVYVLFQSGRLVGQQLRAASHRLAPLLEAVKDDEFDPAVGVLPLNVDAPLQVVLASLASLNLPVDGYSSAEIQRPYELPSAAQGSAHAALQRPQEGAQLSHSPQMIRGIASVIETQHLVLVDTHNQVLDILAADQRRSLDQRITFEIASYSRSQALIQRANQARALLPTGDDGDHQSLTWRFLPPLRQRETMVSPVRFFRSLMGWMQVSPMAQSANLFQESALPQLENAQQFIDAELPQLPSLGQPIQSFATLLFGDSQSRTNQQNHQRSFSETTAQHSAEWFDPDHHSSVDGWFSANQLSYVRRQTEQFLSMPSLPFRRRWIASWDEQVRGSDSIVDSPIEPSANDGQRAVNGTASEQKQQTGSPDAHSSGSGVSAWTDSSMQSQVYSVRQRGRGRPAQTSSSEASDDGLVSTQTEVRDLSPTLVDAKVTVVGYETHPLEQVLHWIDGLMLWVEENASKALKWLQTALKLNGKTRDQDGRSPDDSSTQD